MQSVRFVVVLLLATAVCAQRLPDVFRPQHYELAILTHLNGTDQLRFEGEVKIRFQVIDNTWNITLHAKNLTIDESRIALSSQSGKNCIKEAEFDVENEFYVLHLCESLQQTEEYELIVPFEGPLNSNQTGYYWSSYNDTSSNQTSYLAVTQFSPTFARLAFPCFDEPHLKANFSVTLGYHRNYTGISSTPIVKCQDHQTLENYIWCEHEELLRTSTYLVAYAVHNLTRVANQSSDTLNQVTFASWMQSKVINEGSFLANFAPKVLSHLEKRFDFAFPLKKVDQLAVPTHKFSAMENWGLVTFKENRFVHNESEEMWESKEGKSSTMAHEYTHQWFGNIVTMKWWKDLWLKEGPSTYFGYLTLDALQPDWQSSERNFATDLEVFYRQDAINSTIAISRYVEGSENILKHFSEYVYKKGSLTMRMLNKLLGDDVFYAGIKSFIKQNAYKNVVQADLWLAMQQALSLNTSTFTNVSKIMDSWTLQAGYPLVNVYRNYSTSTFSINQQRFWLENGQKKHPSCWWIPLTFVTQKQANFSRTQPQFWLECPSYEETLELLSKPTADEWIILNPQVTTIYRVNYDKHNWNLIIQTLISSENFEQIHVINRAQLMDDLMALAWTDIQSYELALSLLEYLPHEQQYIPWKRAMKVLHTAGNLLGVGNSEIFKDYMKQLLSPLYARCSSLEMLQKNTTSLGETLLCRLALDEACLVGLESCVQKSLEYSLDSDLSANFRDIVYCTQVEHGTEQFQQVFELFQNSTIATKQSAFASALGCSGNSTELLEYLDYLLLGKRADGSNYYVEAVTSAMRRKHFALETTDHILQHATIINDKLSEKQIKALILLMVENDTISEKALRKLQSLKNFQDTLKMALELRRVNQIWLKKRSREFISAMNNYIKS